MIKAVNHTLIRKVLGFNICRIRLPHPTFNNNLLHCHKFSSISTPLTPASLNHIEYNFFDMSLPSAQERLSSFRDELKSNNIDCFIQSTTDAHQSEYVCNRDKRLGYLSCFTGSAGTIVVTQNEALLWTDGRYFLAANKQISQEWTLMKQGLADTLSVEKWITKNVQNGKIGIDPYLTSISYYKKLKKANLDIVLLNKNPIDAIWDKNQPAMPENKVFVHNIKYCGQTSTEKLKNVQSKINEHNVYALIVTRLDHIAWVLNLRGNDIIYNPVFFSYLLITKNECYLYIDPQKLATAEDEKKSEQKADVDAAGDLQQHLQGVKIAKYADFLPDLESIVHKNADGKFWIDPRQCNLAIFNAIPEQQRFEKDDCIEIMKAVKNETEIKGFFNCHIRDGAAKSRFFAWVDQLRGAGKKELESHTEWTFAEKLLSYRREAALFVDLSFETISSIAGNGAIIHYSPSESEHSAIKANEIYLLDSGGQYFDGTTDTTRTMWLGVDGCEPSEHMKECYTRVLKGFIALTKMVFPSNTKGPMLDSAARAYLWQIGLDYRHGTGHGVGCFLNVHEGPQGFSASTFRRSLFEYGLKTNMIITNEPGYYEADNFGIRIENVMAVTAAKTKHQFGGQEFCTFKSVTMVPIDKQLLDLKIMSHDEVEWLNKYHNDVYKNIFALMKTEYEKDWLKKATEPLVC